MDWSQNHYDRIVSIFALQFPSRQVVGILSQGSTASAYVMGISTAKTILRTETRLELIYDEQALRELVERWDTARARRKAAPRSAGR